MNAKRLGILAVVAAVVVVVAGLAVWRERGAVAPAAQGGVVLPGLAARVNDISRIEVRSGETAVTVERDGAEWGVKELGGYPAKFETVKGVLVGLAGLERTEAKTDRPEGYAKIGVEAPAPENGAVLVTVEDEAGPTALIVGKQAGERVYVRVPEEARAWLAEGKVGAPTGALEWVDRMVAQLDSTRVKSARIERADGSVLVVRRESKETPYEVEGVPEGRSLKTASAGSPVAGGLSYLSLEGVRRAEEVAWDGAVVTEIETFDGLVVLVRTVEAGGKVWAALEASFDATAAPVSAVAPELSTKADGTEPTDQERADAAKKAEEDAAAANRKRVEAGEREAADLNKKWGGWAYEISGAKAEVLRREMEELLAPAEPGEGAGEAGDEEVDGEGGDLDAFGVPGEGG